MEFFFFILFSYLYKYIKNSTIYQCSRYLGMKDQCYNKWVDIYGNTRIDLWICPQNKYCQILSRRENDNSIGVCVYNYRKLYDQDYCSYNSQCASFYCISGKCEGLEEDFLCKPGIFQCKNNLVCKKSLELFAYNEKKELYKCANLSQIDEMCDNSNECDIGLVCSNKSIIDMINNLTFNNISELKEKIKYDDYISNKKDKYKACIEKASLENGIPTEDSMACKSGDTINIEIAQNFSENVCASKKEIIKNCDENNICIIKVNLGKLGDFEIKQNCIFSVRGNPFCPLNQKEMAWKKYLEIYDEYYLKEEVETKRETRIHIPAYKNTFNNLEVSEAYWRYSEWMYSIEADICTKEFFFLKNKVNKIKFSFLYILIQYLLLYI